MSDYRAIASVTATLRSMLQDLADVVVPGTRVEAGPPIAQNGTRSEPVIRIFLYAATPHATLRNIAQPVRRGDGSFDATPVLPLELHYLISFIGDDPQLKAQILLGAVMTFLEVQALPLPSDVRGAEAASRALDGDLTGGLAANEIEMAQFVLETLDHDDLARIWGMFVNVPYAMSVGYRCALVLLRPAIEPAPALPVAQALPIVASTPSPPLQLASVMPASAPAAEGFAVTLRGAGIGRCASGVRFGDSAAEATRIDADTLAVTVPAGLPAGAHSITVTAPGEGGIVSNPAAFALQPRILGPIAVDRHWLQGSSVQIGIAPAWVPGQSARLLLNEITASGAPPRALSIAADPVSQATTSLRFGLPRLRAGRFLARIEIDGTVSDLDRDDDPASATFERFTGPILEVH